MSDQKADITFRRGVLPDLSARRISSERVAIIPRVIMLTALWQDDEMDQMRPTSDAIAFAGTACGEVMTKCMRASMAARILAARDLDTLKVYDFKSIRVPSATMEWRGK